MASRNRRRRTQGVRPRDPLSVDDIVATAIRLVDEHGADAFSVRLLATEMGVYPTSIYWHVGDRSGLLALISDAWMRDVMPSPVDKDWLQWLREMGYAYRSAAARHPNVARLISGELVNNPLGFGLPEAIISQLARAGLPPDEMVHAYNVIVGATAGFVDLEFARDPRRTQEDREHIEHAVRSVDPEQYPTLSRYIDHFADRAFSLRWTSAAEAPLDASFSYLVELIIDGLRRRSEAARTAPTTPTSPV